MPATPTGSPSMMPGEQDLVFGVIAVRLGYVTPDDVLAAAREVLPPAARNLAQVLEAHGVLTTLQRDLVEQLVARAVTDARSAATTLQMLPVDARRLLAESSPPKFTPSRPLPAREQVCVEQDWRYQPSPDGAAGGQYKHDAVFGRDVTWRTAVRETDEVRLLAEARLTAQLDHPAVLPVFEAGRAADGALYVTTQRVGQRTLATAILEAHTVADRLRLVPRVVTVSQCLTAAHERGITHGALKTDAVLLGDFGEVYVTRWVAASRDADGFAHREREDIKALGALLHEVVTGVPLTSQTKECAGAPQDLLALARIAARGGTEQLPSLDAFTRELKAWVEGRQVASHRYSPWQLVARFAERNRAFATAAVAALGLMLALGALTLERMEHERDRARNFARVFLDDVGQKLQALPGVEPLLDQMTTRAIAHYERTMELERAPRQDRLRVARAVARLAALSTELGRLDEAARSADFAAALVATVATPDAESWAISADLLITRARLALARDLVSKARDLAREAVTLADRAVESAPLALAPVDLAVRARLVLAGVTDRDEARVAMTRVIELATRASARAPDDLAALRLFSVALAARADAAREEAPLAGGELLEEALAVARRAIESGPEEDELQVLLTERLVGLAASLRARALEAEALPLLEEARTRSLQLLRRTPGHVAARQALVSIEFELGHFDAAWRLARELEGQSQVARVSQAPLAALLAGHFDDAIRFASRADTRATSTLVHALAEAMGERSPEAVVQARALRGRMSQVEWTKVLVGTALEQLGAQGPAGAAALELGRALDSGADRSAALEAFISALEATLPHH